MGTDLQRLTFGPSLVTWVLRLSVPARFHNYYDLCWLPHVS